MEPTGTNRSNPLDPRSSTKSWPILAKAILATILAKTENRRRAAASATPQPAPTTTLPPAHSQIPHGHKFPTGTNSPRAQIPGTQIPGQIPGANLHKSSRGREPPRGAINRGPGQPGGHSEGPNTRSHPELGRENPQRRWYCVSRRGRAGRRQALPAPTPSPPRPSPHPNPTPRITRLIPGAHTSHLTAAGWSSPVARQAHNWRETRRRRGADGRTALPDLIRGPTHHISPPRGGAAR